MTPEHIFSVLEKVAISSPERRYRLAAAVVFRGRIISIGQNSFCSNPFQAKYASNPERIFWHAEANSIHRALKEFNRDFLKKCSLYVCRVKYENSRKRNFITGNSFPCAGCWRCINDFGIKQVWHTLDGSSEHRNKYALLQCE